VSDVGPTDVTADGTAAAAEGEAEDGADGVAELETALDALRSGEPLCVHDFDDREGETDLLYPATAVDAGDLATLRNDAGGLVCVALSGAVADAADLPLFADAIDHPAVETSDLAYGDRSSFSLTVNHRDTYTGITDEDRALTISEVGEFAGAVATGRFDEAGEGATEDSDGGTNAESAVSPEGTADPAEAFAAAFRIPGHVHLLRAADGLLAERRGHTELGVALAAAAGIAPAVVVCEMLDDETGEALSVAGAREYAGERGIPFLEGEAVVAALERR